MKKTKLLPLIMVASMLLVMFTACSKFTGVEKKESIAKEGQIASVDSSKENQSEESKYNITVNENDVTFTDATGEKVSIKKNPQKVVCLYNSYLDIWDNCGGKVIGKVEESEEKPVVNAASAEVVGEAGSPSLEKILALQPDLVIMTDAFSAQKEMIPILKQNNIQVIALGNDYRNDYLETVKLFTAITGREDLYKTQAEEVNQAVEDVIKKVPEDKNYKVLIMFASAKSLSVRNSESMVGEMLRDLKTINISDIEGKTSDSSDSKTFSIEKIIQEDPDYIFVLTMGNDMEKIQERIKSDAENNPAWASLTAVKEDRYIVLPKDLYMYKPNNRYAEAYENLAKILYPEVFK